MKREAQWRVLLSMWKEPRKTLWNFTYLTNLRGTLSITSNTMHTVKSWKELMTTDKDTEFCVKFMYGFRVQSVNFGSSHQQAELQPLHWSGPTANLPHHYIPFNIESTSYLGTTRSFAVTEHPPPIENHRWQFAWISCLRTALCRRTWACSQTSWLHLDQLSTPGASEGSPDHGNKGGWKPRTHWNGVRPVEEWVSEFCTYSAQGRKSLQRCCSLLQ